MDVLVELKSAVPRCSEASTPALGNEQCVSQRFGQLGCQRAESADRQLWGCDQLLSTAEEPVREAELYGLDSVGDPTDRAVAVRDE
ncbi:hypothetical protein [Streptomyces sp. NBC_00075]|uniref:hypothetical protein n=1 Tax=Streptomyces sp. NBC_00075 TaxID=2975641 RepID=UPI00386553E4